MLKGAVVLVTGAGKGIGEATATAVAKEGARVIVAARSAENLAAVAGRIANGGGDCLPLAADITSEASVGELFAKIDAQYGRIDVLVNNAGLLVVQPLEKTTIADWNSVVGTNLTGPFLCSRAAIPMMRRQGGGHIINIASLAGLTGIANHSAYCAAKFGVVGQSQSLGRELLNDRIRVSYVCPGTVDTDMLKAYHESEVRDLKKANPEEIARQVLALILQQRRPDPNSLAQKLLRKLRNRLGVQQTEIYSSF